MAGLNTFATLNHALRVLKRKESFCTEDNTKGLCFCCVSFDSVHGALSDDAQHDYMR